MSFLRRLVPGMPGGGDDGSDEEGEALLEHEGYSSSDSESSSSNQDEERMDHGSEYRARWDLPQGVGIGPRNSTPCSIMVYT